MDFSILSFIQMLEILVEYCLSISVFINGCIFIVCVCVCVCTPLFLEILYSTITWNQRSLCLMLII